MSVHLLAGIGSWIIVGWDCAAFAAMLLPARRRGKAIQVTRALCIPAFLAFVAITVDGPASPAWLWWVGEVAWPIWWWRIHREHHRGGHGRRLRDAATGWVRRRGNRLTVIPATGGAS